MRILGRHCSSAELLLFAICYMLGNYVVFRMQQTWADQKMEEEEMNSEKVQMRDIHNQAQGNLGQHARPSPAQVAMHRLSQELLGDQEPRYQYEEHQETRNPSQDQDEDGRYKLETKAPLVTAGSFDNFPSEKDLDQFDAEKVEREELRRERLGNPNEEGYKTILFWNKFFNSDDFRFGVGHQPFIEHKCPVHQCITTMDKRKLAHADLVMFHGPRIDNFPPPQRPKGQVYAYVQQEPHYAMSAEEIPKYNGYMNVTITHRRDSDIWIPYAKVVYDPDNASNKPIHVNPKDRPRSITWVVSHCSTPGKREWYVQELQKYIDIDVYGDCGDMECSKDDTWYCYEKFAKEYRFYMALENNYCKDYVSEKTFRPLAYNIVPIVFGGANYSDLTPPHSVIDILDYPHPKDLAKYLHYLMQNEKAYNKYFQWKTKGYELDTSRKAIMGQAFCRLCEMLHDPNFKYKEYKNLKYWWTNDACDAYAIPRLRRKAKW